MNEYDVDINYWPIKYKANVNINDLELNSKNDNYFYEKLKFDIYNFINIRYFIAYYIGLPLIYPGGSELFSLFTSIFMSYFII